jgi:DNA replication protein DnaC
VGDDADRAMEAAAAEARERQAARSRAGALDGVRVEQLVPEPAPDQAGIISVDEHDRAQLARMSVLVIGGFMVRVGALQFRETTPAEREQKQLAAAERVRRDAEFEQCADRMTWLARIQRLWEQTGVDERNVAADLQNIGDVHPGYRVAVAEVLKTIDSPKLVALIGRRGVGKTDIACGLVREFCRRGRRARYLRTLELFRLIRATWGRGRGEDSEADVMDLLRQVDLLVLDEFQVQSGSDWERHIVTDLIDVRYAKLRATVLIANLEPNALNSAMGDSVSARFQEWGTRVECDWPSFRRERTARAAVEPIRGASGERFVYPPIVAGAVPTMR